MVWIPSLNYIRQVFEMLKSLPECKDLENASCINPTGIEGVIDKIEFGLPMKDLIFWEKSAILIRDLIQNHYFSDGNKRIGFIILVIYLARNNFRMTASDDEKIHFALEIAQGKLNLNEIASWIKNNVDLT